MTRKPKDLGASVQARLRNIAWERQVSVQMVLTQFVLERLLHRLSVSRHGRQFILKGAMLFLAWTRIPHRATQDIDLLGRGEADLSRLAGIFRDVCLADVVADGVTFDPGSVRASRIREDRVYEAVRVTLAARLGSARVDAQVDIGFGDAVHPEPSEISFPSLLGHPPALLLAYPRETVVAEKFEAMVSLGLLNSRMKDFYDVLVLSEQFEFEGGILASAIRGTLDRRQTSLPEGTPVALCDEFAASADKQRQWLAFVRRTRLGGGHLGLGTVVAGLRRFLMPLVRALRGEQPLPHFWDSRRGWLEVGPEDRTDAPR